MSLLPRERNFVHLHNHMEGSYSDSALPLAAALDRVAELGMPAFALTDHGEMAMVRRFASAAQARGIRPLVGVEAYFVEDAAANIRHHVNFRHHLTLVAASARGYANLIKIVTGSWRDNCLMQKLGLVDWKLLEAHGEDVLCLSGCLAGPVAWSFMHDDPAEADRFYGRFSELFGDRYYLEVFAHGMPEETKAVAGIRALADRYGRQVVLTNDCHYLNEPDWTLHDTLIKTRFGRPTDFALPYHEYFIKSADEMRTLDFPADYCDVTLDIADRVTLTAEEILAGPTPSSPERPVTESTSLFGNRAFLGVRTPLGRALSLEKAASVQSVPASEVRKLAKLSPEAIASAYPEALSVAERIEDLPGMPRPDLDRLVVLDHLEDRVPLRRSEETLFTAWDEEDCLAVGAKIDPVSAHPDLMSLAASTKAYFSGLDEYRHRRHNAARVSFTRALEIRPDFLNARYQLGLVEYYADDVEHACGHFEAVLTAAPDFERVAHLHSYLGWCLFRLSEYARAREHFEMSLSEKQIPGSMLGLGLVLEHEGELEAARDTLLKLVEQSPDFSRLNTAQRALERIIKALEAA